MRIPPIAGGRHIVSHKPEIIKMSMSSFIYGASVGPARRRVRVFGVFAAAVLGCGLAGCQTERHKTVTKTVDETPTEKVKTTEKHEVKTETTKK